MIGRVLADDKIRWSVVTAVSVDVMHMSEHWQRLSKRAFGDHAMLARTVFASTDNIALTITDRRTLSSGVVTVARAELSIAFVFELAR